MLNDWMKLGACALTAMLTVAGCTNGNAACRDVAGVTVSVTGHERDACTASVFDPSGNAIGTYSCGVPQATNACQGSPNPTPCAMSSCSVVSGSVGGGGTRESVSSGDTIEIAFDPTALRTAAGGTTYSITVTCGQSTLLDHKASTIACAQEV